MHRTLHSGGKSADFSELAHVCHTSAISLGLRDGPGRRRPASARGRGHPGISCEQGLRSPSLASGPGLVALRAVLLLTQPCPPPPRGGGTAPWGFMLPYPHPLSMPRVQVLFPLGAQKPWPKYLSLPWASTRLWVFRISVPPPGSASSWLPLSVSPSTLWPPLPRLPGIPLIGSCWPGHPPPPAPGLGLGSQCLSDDQGRGGGGCKWRTPACLEMAQRL